MIRRAAFVLLTIPWVAGGYASGSWAGDGQEADRQGTSLVPTEIDRQTIQALARALPQEHLSAHPIDAEIADRTLELYLESLDALRSYFTQQDIDGLRRRTVRLDDQIKRGELAFAFEIYRMYLDRLRGRNVLYEELLNQPLNLEEDDWYAEETSYARSEQDMRDRWTKIVKHHLLIHLAAGADEAEAKRRAWRARLQAADRLEKYDSADVTALWALALSSAYDPHTHFYSRRQMEARQSELAGQFVGVGLRLADKDGYITISQVLPNGPAAASGQFKEGDRIVGVGQGADGELVATDEKSLNDVIDLIRGPEGSQIRLQVLPRGQFEAAVHALTRARVDVSNFASALLTGEPLADRGSAKIGYIYLPTFYHSDRGDGSGVHSTVQDVRRALGEFTRHKADVVVLDLRENYGGQLTEAIALPGLFLGPEAIVLQVKGRDGKIQPYTATDTPLAWNGPVVCLTSRLSAGGAEITVAAIQDHRRGLIVGDAKTHGMGTVSSALDLRAEGAAEGAPLLGRCEVVYLKYYRPNGDGMQIRGVAPDIGLPSPYDAGKWGEEQYRFALPSDQVAPAQFESRHEGLDDAWITALSQRSAERRAAAPYFQQLAARLTRERENAGKFSLRRDAFLAAQAESAEPDPSAAPLSGIPEVKLDGYLREALSIGLDYAARVLVRQADQSVAQRRYGDAIQAFDRATAADPAYAEAFRRYAWLLGTCPDASFRNGANAVKHAQRASELRGDTVWQYDLTWAVAEAEARNFDAALAHLQTALDAAPEAERATWSYLAERFQRRQTFAPR